MHQDSEVSLERQDHQDLQEAVAPQEDKEIQVAKESKDQREQRVNLEELVLREAQVNRVKKDKKENLDWMVQEGHQYVSSWSLQMHTTWMC